MSYHEGFVCFISCVFIPIDFAQLSVTAFVYVAVVPVHFVSSLGYGDVLSRGRGRGREGQTEKKRIERRQPLWFLWRL